MVALLSKEQVISLKVFADYKNSMNFRVYGIVLGYNKSYSYDEKIVYSGENLVTESFYIPISHNIETQLEDTFVFNGLKSLIENDSIKKFVHDSKTEVCIFNKFGVELKGVIFDTMLACYIKNSNANSDFDIQCMEQINHILPTIVSTSKSSSLADNDISSMKNYAGDVVASLFELTNFWANSLDDKEHKILSDIELPLAFVLAKMEEVGVSVDIDYLNELTNEFDKKAHNLEQRIYELAGEGFNINSPKQVAYILFEKLELKSSKKRGKTKNSTSAEVLNALAEEYEIAQLILDYRKYAKLKSTYTEALPALIEKDDNRIHTSYNQTVTTTGRLSSSNPNLQNIPIRTEEGNKIRKAFVPKDRNNYLLMSADYSQIELRLLAHVSGDVNLINAFNSGIDVHTLTASKVFEVPIEEVTKEMRYKAKAVNFGIVYGQSKYGLAKALGIKGYVETIWGRKRYLETEINSPNAMIREFAKRAAINHPMQGSASDLIKMAMIDFAKALESNNLKSRLVMQVHDELVVEVAKDELEQVKQLVLNSMELNQPLSVKLLVDVNVGESWKES